MVGELRGSAPPLIGAPTLRTGRYCEKVAPLKMVAGLSTIFCKSASAAASIASTPPSTSAVVKVVMDLTFTLPAVMSTTSTCSIGTPALEAIEARYELLKASSKAASSKRATSRFSNWTVLSTCWASV